jgi:hypothetical protein
MGLVLFFEYIFDSAGILVKTFLEEWKIRNRWSKWNILAINEKVNGIDNILIKGPLSHGFR